MQPCVIIEFTLNGNGNAYDGFLPFPGRLRRSGDYVMKRGKEHMKRTKRLLLFIAIAVGLSGCGNSAEEIKNVPEVKIEKIPVEEVPTESESAETPPDGESSMENQTTPGEKVSGEEKTSGEEEISSKEEPSGKIAPAQVKDRPQGWSLTLASEDWGLSFGEPGTAPRGNASAEDLAWYDAYFVDGDEEKTIYLTFDCGYENGNTEPILDALKKHNAPGTFFVVGHFLETAPDMVKRMVEEGHAVGNHTYHHPDMSAISDRESFQKEMDGVADLFYEITGTELSPFYRPPQGKCNTKNLEMAQELGYYTIFWSLAHVDWITDNQPSHEEALDKLTERIHPGAIVLLHNTSQTNGEILDELLTKWEEMGYSFKPLAELVG